MRIYVLALIVALGTLSVSNAQDAESKLDTAKSTYTERMLEARDTLDDAIGKLITKTQANRRLSTPQKIAAVDQLKAQQKAFINLWRIPTDSQLRGAITTFQRVKRVETSRIRQAFDDAADTYGDAGDLDAAKAILKEKEDFLRSMPTTKSIFNGIDLSGWKGDLGRWSVANGILVGDATAGLTPKCYLYTAEEFGDFELRCKIKFIGQNANSGILIRGRVLDAENSRLAGPECDASSLYWGGLWSDQGWVQQAPENVVRQLIRQGAFNDMLIRCVGSQVLIRLNGHATVDAKLLDIPPRGVIGLQLQRTKKNGPFKAAL